MNIDEHATHLVEKYEHCNRQKFDLYLFMRQVAREVKVIEELNKKDKS